MRTISKPAAIQIRKLFHRDSRSFRRVRVFVAVILMALCGCAGSDALAQSEPTEHSVVLAWDPVPGDGIAGYRLYYGLASRNYTKTVEVGLAPTATVSGLAGGVMYYFAVTAVDFSGQESDFSEEISFSLGNHRLRMDAGGPNGTVLRLQGTAGHRYDIEASADLENWAVIGSVTVPEDGSGEFADPDGALFSMRFYRSRRSP